MPVEPIEARCRACGRELLLIEVVKATGGACPSCGRLLAPGYTHLLLDEARRAEVLQRELVLALRRLVGMPGTLELKPESVFRNAVASVGWDELLADNQALVQAEAEALRPAVRSWRDQPKPQRERLAPALVARIRALAERARRHGDLLEHRNVELRAAGDETSLRALREPDGVRHAADELDAAAEAITADARLADDTARAALNRARDSVDESTVGTTGGTSRPS
jgi:hypothetical protein